MGHRLIYRKYCKSCFQMISTENVRLKREGKKKQTATNETDIKKTGFHAKHSTLHSHKQIGRLIFKMRFRRNQNHTNESKQNCKIIIILSMFFTWATTRSLRYSVYRQIIMNTIRISFLFLFVPRNDDAFSKFGQRLDELWQFRNMLSSFIDYHEIFDPFRENSIFWSSKLNFCIKWPKIHYFLVQLNFKSKIIIINVRLPRKYHVWSTFVWTHFSTFKSIHQKSAQRQMSSSPTRRCRNPSNELLSIQIGFIAFRS